ncbi:uncharacterized protein ACRADG_003299 isoform 8-T8 [Cochliomyia hominivorax]
MNVRDLSMRMDYQLPPQTLQLASNAVVGSLMSSSSGSNGNNNILTQQQLNQQQNAQLQLLQLNHQQQQQQQQQQLVTNQQQQQLLTHMSGGQQTLPSLSSLPLQVVNQLPHLLANSAGNNNSNNNNNSTNLNNLNILNNNLTANNNNNNNSSSLNTSNSNTTTSLSSNLTCNSSSNNNNNNNNVLLRNTMQHVANANQQLQQTINNLSNNLVSSLPPSSQLLQHHLQHLANVNNAVVQLNNSNNNNNSNSNSNSSSPSNNSLSNSSNNNNNNLLLNNNNPSTPNNNLATHLSDNVVAHNIVNGLVGVLNNVNNNNNNSNNNNNTNLNINNNNSGNQNNSSNNLEDNNRWTQFQVQQLWKQHASYLNGKSTSNSKEVICPDDKYKEEGDLWNVEAQTAFLGPNLWEKTLPYDADLKVTQYADLDEFLSENNIPDGLPGTHLGHSSSLGHRSDSLSHAAGLSLGLGHITTKRERSPSPSDCISPDTLNPPSPAESTFSFASSGRDFDPRTRAFSDEELKPQPMIKKSRKQFVPDELKDDKYWARRRKNNIAAKRSRDARRQKENQIAMRARYLEKENATLHQEVEQLKQENMDLRARLSKFQDV